MAFRRGRNKNASRVLEVNFGQNPAIPRRSKAEDKSKKLIKIYDPLLPERDWRRSGKTAPEKKMDVGLRLMRSARTCDGLVLVGRERVPVRVHRAVLAANSPFFEQLFFPRERRRSPAKGASSVCFSIAREKVVKEADEVASEEVNERMEEEEVKGKISKEVKDTTKEEMKEEVKSSFAEKLKNGEIDADVQIYDDMELTMVEVPEFNAFMEYCYTGRLSLPSFEVGMKMYKLASEFQMPNLNLDITAVIQNFITVDNALQLFFAISRDDCSVVKEFAKSFVIENAEKIFTKKNVFKDCSIADIVELLELRLKVREDTILTRVLEYADSSLGVGMDKGKRRKAMQAVLNLVNVKRVGAEGVRQARNSGLFKKDVLLEAVLANREVDKLLLPLLH